MTKKTDSNPIDLVISWVDGNDPEHKRKLAQYSEDVKFASMDDVAGETRYANLGEINFCVASVNKYMKFIRKIFIITDNQDPDLEVFLSEHFNDPIPIEIVDHTVIFKDYEEYLPTFNSRAIETLMWRIPGLSEHFLYMNDDFLIIKECRPEDFFIDGKVVCYADWYSSLWARLLTDLKPRHNGHKTVNFKSSLLNSLEITGGGPRFLYLTHSPRALLKSSFERFYKANPELILRNIRHKFRNIEQYNSQEVFYLNEHRKGNCIVANPKGPVVYLEPKSGKDYFKRKLHRFDSDPRSKFCCFNSLDQASAEDQGLVLDWVSKKIL